VVRTGPDPQRKPIASSTFENWEATECDWLNSHLGHMPLPEVNNSSVKVLVSKMADCGLSPKRISTYAQTVRAVAASPVDEEA